MNPATNHQNQEFSFFPNVPLLPFAPFCAFLRRSPCPNMSWKSFLRADELASRWLCLWRPFLSSLALLDIAEGLAQFRPESLDIGGDDTFQLSRRGAYKTPVTNENPSIRGRSYLLRLDLRLSLAWASLASISSAPYECLQKYLSGAWLCSWILPRAPRRSHCR